MIIGITGLIGSGKSKIGSYIANNMRICVEDCDDIAHDLYKDADIVNQIEEIVGKHRNADNSFSRQSLLKYLLKYPEEMTNINHIMHPAIINIVEKTVREKKSKNQHLVVMAPLLFECEMEDMFNTTVYVYTDHDIRVKRLMDNRGMNKKTIEFFDNFQIPPEKKFSMCDRIFLNNSGLDGTFGLNMYSLCMKIF